MAAIYNTRGIYSVWILLGLFAIQNGGLHGPSVAADDSDKCDRTVTDITSEVTVAVGDDLALTCYVDTSQTKVSIIWYRNEDVVSDNNSLVIIDYRYNLTPADDVNGCESNRLIIENVDAYDDGTFTCGASGLENGTILVRVSDSPSSGTTALPPTSQPTCNTNVTVGEYVHLNDHITLSCSADDQLFPLYSLDWVGLESAQVKEDLSTNVVVNVSTALRQSHKCSLTCDENNQNCDSSTIEGDPSCQIQLLSVSSDFQTVPENENASFTCSIGLTGYSVLWFIPHITDLQHVTEKSENNQSSTITLFNLQAGQTGSLLCVVQVGDETISEAFRLAKFNVSSSSNETNSTTNTTKNFKTASVYLSPYDPSVSQPSFPLSLNLIIIIAICSALVFIFLIIIVCFVYRQYRISKQPAFDINPVLAYGDIRHLNDSAVNLDVHFNIYTQEVYDEPARLSLDVLRLDRPRRSPTTNGGIVENNNRVTSFQPIADRSRDWRNSHDERPGQRLNFYVENDIYVTGEFDSFA